MGRQQPLEVRMGVLDLALGVEMGAEADIPVVGRACAARDWRLAQVDMALAEQVLWAVEVVQLLVGSQQSGEDELDVQPS